MSRLPLTARVAAANIATVCRPMHRNGSLGLPSTALTENYFGIAFLTRHSILLLATLEAAWYINVILVLSVYVCQTITFESLDVGSSYLHMR